MAKEEKETPEVETEEVEAPETPTETEQLKTAQDEVTKIKAELEGKDKGLRTAHQTLTEKDRKIKEQADINARLDGFEDTQKILIAMMQEKGTVSDEEVTSEKKTDYLKQYDEILKKQREARKTASAQAEQEEYATKAQAIYSRAQEAFKDDIDELDKVVNNLDKGRLDMAETRVSKAEGKANPEPKESKKETEEQRVDRLADEKYNKRLEDEGLLHTETALPSGRSRTMDELRAKHAAGEITTEEAEKGGLTF